MQIVNNKNKNDFLNYDGIYDTVSVEQDPNGYVYTFENVILGKAVEDANIVCLNGTYVVFSGVPHYFHFLKECLSVFLYVRRTIDKDAKYLWIDHDHFYFPLHQDMRSIHSSVFQMMSQFDGVRLKDTDLSSKTLLIEKLVVMWDSQMVIVNNKFPKHDYGKTPMLNAELRQFFSEYAVDNSSLPKKIFLTRKIVSEELPKHPDHDNASQRWKKEQMRLRWNEPWIEDAIEDYFMSLGYSIFQLSGMSLKDQVQLFYNTDYVAGLLGTAFYNGIFSKSGTRFAAIRTNPNYWYNFEGDIKSVITTDFNYVNIYEKQNYKQVQEVLARSAELF